ncbi:MAG: hypothetical protein AVDCRST_MAG50-1387 [uncultured Acidimicrobiales bacterium]|uniref:Uncharacterized protein n=1 Tax=uncultured Acidimicrobiales bacterium TaxID=310071 RepID=A0A6J4HW47_9ACTN|nr:MAG: hypothetical protein AVDCRST_MAG50-1387 [uncultured Acidimicrobiales bacterium]
MLVKLIIGAPMVYLSLRIGFWMLKGLANPLPGPPPAGEMRRVNVRFRCSICGVEIRMTAAPNEDPEPPRHCLEDMDLVAPVE